VFNFSGSEVLFLLILGLVILGPEKLPGVLRKAGRLYGEFKRVTSDAQTELRQALDQPIREIQSTAKTYQGFFVDAAKEVTKDPEKTPERTTTSPNAAKPESSTPDDPTFVPYQAPPTAASPGEPTAEPGSDEGGTAS
jgi:Tat protein translocase TatB subunit